MKTAEQHIQDVIERTAALAMYQIRKDSMRIIAELHERISWELSWELLSPMQRQRLDKARRKL